MQTDLQVMCLFGDSDSLLLYNGQKYTIMLTEDDIEDCAKVRYIKTVILRLFYIVYIELYIVSTVLYCQQSLFCIGHAVLVKNVILYCDGWTVVPSQKCFILLGITVQYREALF